MIPTSRKICKKPYLGEVAVILDLQGQLASQIAEARRQDQLPQQERYDEILPGSGGSDAGPPRPTGKPGSGGKEAGSVILLVSEA